MLTKHALKMLAPDTGGSGDGIAAKVGEAVADAAACVADESVSKPASKKDDEDEKLDAKAELFVRRITDNVTKAIADLLKPPKAEASDDDDGDDSGDSKRKPRKRTTSPPAAKPKSLLERLF